MVCAALALYACNSDPQLAELQEKVQHLEKVRAAEKQSYEATIERLDARVAELETKLELGPTDASGSSCEGLQQQIEQLRADLAVAQAQASEYRNGLERAVAELNIRNDMQRASNQRTRRRPDPGKVRARSPVVFFDGPDLVVEGSVYNSNRDSVYGAVVVEILADGQVYDSRERELRISGRTSAEYELRFRSVAHGQNYRAVVRWES